MALYGDFFVLAGASLEFDTVKKMGLIGILYIICCGIGKYLGTRIGSHFSGADQATKTWMDAALLPQAGGY